MGLDIELSVVLAFGVGLIILYILGWLLIVPLKYLTRLIINGVVGGILLLVVNFFGGYIGLHIGINPVTALIAGLLGVPGVIMLIILQFIL